MDKSLEKLYNRMYRRSGSRATALNYVKCVKLFTGFLGYESPDQVLEAGIDFNEAINNWIDYLLFNRGVARSTINIYVAAVKKWLKVNGVKLEGEIELPTSWIVERDRIPTRSELRKLYSVGSLTDRVILTLAVSSGLRASTIVNLRIGDIDLDNEIPVIKVRPEIAKDRPRRGYITFCSPECREHILQYLEYKGNFDPDNYLLEWNGRPYTPHTLSVKWDRLLRKAGLTDKSRKWFKLRFHTLRKYFKTYATLSGIPSDVVEAFMGHVSGIRHIYFYTGVESMENPKLIEMLRNEYRKAIPYLTINVTEDQLKAIEEKIEVLAERQKTLEEKLRETLNMIDRIIDHTRRL